MAKTKKTPRYCPQKKIEFKSGEWISSDDTSSEEGEPCDPVSAPYPPWSASSASGDEEARPIESMLEEGRKRWQCIKCNRPPMKTREGPRKHYTNVHSVVWFHSSQTFRDLTPAKQHQQTINRKLWQSKKIAVVTAAPQLGDLGGSVKGNSRAKVPTAAETGAVAINPVCTPDRHLARVKNVRRQSLQRLPQATFESLPLICLDAPMDHPTVRKSTHPSLPGKRKATATVISEADRVNEVLFGVVSSSSSGEGTPSRLLAP